jgi:predicted nucleotidyltransferase
MKVLLVSDDQRIRDALRCALMLAGHDIDVAIEIETGRSFLLIRMEDIRLLLESVLGRSVDLGEVESFRPAVRAAFERDQVRVF